MSEFLSHLQGLRAHYGADNPIGLLLDELIKDVEAGAPRKEIKADCRALLKELDPTSTAARAIRQFLTLKAKRKSRA
jgi:hypothetical protein